MSFKVRNMEQLCQVVPMNMWLSNSSISLDINIYYVRHICMEFAAEPVNWVFGTYFTPNFMELQ